MKEVEQRMEYFRPRQKLNYSNLPFVSRPRNNQTFTTYASGQDGFAAFVHSEVRQAISEKAEEASPNETVGLLAGRVLRDEHGAYTLVLAIEGARPQEIEATPSRVRMSANGQAEVRSRLETSAYGLDVIGWYHSHPRFPAQFSPEDFIEQSTWRDPNHIGIVISGLGSEKPLGVYRGPQASVLTPSLSLPPPPPPPIKRDSSDYSHGVAVDATSNSGIPSGSASRKTVWITRWRIVRRFLPAVLGVVVLGSLLFIAQLNNRLSKLESAMGSLTSEERAPVALSPAIPNPTSTSVPQPNLLSENVNTASPPDPVNRQTTKALVLHSTRRQRSPTPKVSSRGMAKKPKAQSPR